MWSLHHLIYYTVIAFTRTLTTLYSMTLLSLFTNLQLSILGRHKYIQSVLQQARDEQVNALVQDSFDITRLIGGGPPLESCYADDDLQHVDPISEETERKFLTLSWWILHVGWKDVGERVRRGVEEVFERYVEPVYDWLQLIFLRSACH